MCIRDSCSAGKMHRHLGRLNKEERNVVSRPLWDVLPQVSGDRQGERSDRDIDADEHAIIAHQRVDAARILDQERGDDKGEASIHDDDAVAQRLDAIGADERHGSHQNPYHGCGKKGRRYGCQRGYEAATPQEDEDSQEQGDLADEQRGQPEICKTLSDDRVTQQHARQQHEITVA